MARVRLHSILIFTASLGLFGGAAVVRPARADDGFRCNGRIISTGEWINRVIDKCGEPAAEMHRTEFRTIRIRVGNFIEERIVEVVIDEMKYDLGSNRFRRYLYFENGRLLSTTTGDKGSG